MYLNVLLEYILFLRKVLAIVYKTRSINFCQAYNSDAYVILLFLTTKTSTIEKSHILFIMKAGVARTEGGVKESMKRDLAYSAVTDKHVQCQLLANSLCST